ncbi:MAG TPA: AI-2E family transporter [Burkholderiaceae bacterium]
MHPGDDHAHDEQGGATPRPDPTREERAMNRREDVHVIPAADEAAVLMLEDVDAEGAPRSRRRERVVLHTPVDVRSGSAVVLSVLLSLYALHWAAEIVIPVLMGLLFSYALSPVVDRLCRLRVPRPLSAGIVMVMLVGGLAWATYSLSDQANNLLESLPDAAQKLRSTLHANARHNDNTTMAQVQKAAATLELAAADAGSRPAPGVAKVQIVKPGFNIQDYLLTGTVRAAEGALQAIVVAFITYFLLAAGDTFRRKLARIAGPSFAKRKITVQALDEISDQVRRYLLVQLLGSVIVGAATGLAFLALGMNNAAVWGVVAGVLNLIPYVGTAVTGGASAVVALLQFGTIKMALAVAAVSVVAHIVTGWGLTPWLTSRTSRLNAVVVFIGVLAWGWLWGVWGLLLGTPILMAVKAVCDRVDDWKPLGELMGGNDRPGDRVASGTAEP